MAGTYSQILLHIVFSTKERRPFLEDAAVRNEMHDYLGGTCNHLGLNHDLRALDLGKFSAGGLV